MFTAKEVADYMNTKFMEVMNMPVIEVLGIVMVITAKAEYNKLTQPSTK